MKKVLFLGSKPIGYFCLEHLIDNSDKLNLEVIGVLSNNNNRFGNTNSILDLCEKNDIPFIPDLDDILNFDVDIILSVQYHLILRQKHIDVAKDIAINLHMAPLPEFRGCNQFSFAIYNGVKEFGTTLHRLEAGIDSGAIMMERRFQIEDEEDVKSLYDKTYAESKRLFVEGLPHLAKGTYKLIPQSSYTGQRDQNIYYRRDIAKLKEIYLDDDGEEIARKVRATAMPGFEPPYALFKNRKYYITLEKYHN